MTSSTGRKSSETGLTLIEVLVAVAILSVGMVAIFSSFDVSVSALAASREALTAGMLLQEKLAELEIEGLPSSSRGRFAGPGGRFWWDVAASGLREGGKSELCLVEVAVWHEDSRIRRSVTTYVRCRDSQ